jgi:hypothetical protein
MDEGGQCARLLEDLVNYLQNVCLMMTMYPVVVSSLNELGISVTQNGLKLPGNYAETS